MTRNIIFFEAWSWFKFNNLRLTLGTNLKFCTILAKGLKLKVRKFCGLNTTFVEVTGEKLVEEAFLTPTHPFPPIMNRVNKKIGLIKLILHDEADTFIINFCDGDKVNDNDK